MQLLKIFPSRGWVDSTKVSSYQIGIHQLETVVELTEETFQQESILLTFNEIIQEGIVAIFSFEDRNFFLHIKNNHIICTPYLNGYSNLSIDLTIQVFHTRFKLEKTTFEYQLFDTTTKTKILIDQTVFFEGIKELEIINTRQSEEPYIYAKVMYHNFITFLEYTIRSQVFSLKTAHYIIYGSNARLAIDFNTNNEFFIISEHDKQKIMIHSLIKNKQIKLLDKFIPFVTEPIILKVNSRVMIIEQTDDKKSLLIKYDKRSDLLFNRATYKVKRKNNKLVFYGEIDYKTFIPIDTLISGKGLILGKVTWHTKRKFSVPIDEDTLIKLPDIHNSLHFSIGTDVVHSMFVYTETVVESTTILTAVIDNNVYAVRINNSQAYSITTLPTLPMYERKGIGKIKLASSLSKVIKPFVKHTTINLYFEKEASRACESSRFVFDAAMTNKEVTAKNYFILDKSSSQFAEMKTLWGKNIVRRFSFYHYLLIFLSDTFIASELSSHVISTRVYNNLLVQKINKTPLYFLQHGIMFAKPVDNPMALGFHKKNQVSVIIKNVISSDLEAGEFYKMGYTDDDLMKTGLPKLDGAHLEASADKIAYMPTWRFWEESFVLNNEIEKTTYFKSIMNVIQIFEDADLLDRLIITPHNKFSQYIAEKMTKYQHLICSDPTEALKISKIFITDYSSIIYDATYRGAYPIFYWKDSDYLIDKYEAIPPVNKDNAPGTIAWTDEQLINAVNEAISQNYRIPDDVMKKYRKINEFHDNKNTERVITTLQNEGVL